MSAASPVLDSMSELAISVRASLSGTPKRLDSKWFYDALGSQLFEAICKLPWYPVTRGETALLASHAQEMMRAVPDVATIIELGPGAGDKLALVAAGVDHEVEAHLVDVSEEALMQARKTLATLAHVTVVPHRATYDAGLQRAVRETRGNGQRLVLFLGSNIGNFQKADAQAFLGEIRRALDPGDALLLGTDLVKAERALVDAYDDPLGVTAAFNKNVLRRMNDELGADFDLRAFEHHAEWNELAGRMEMHLASKRSQRVRVPGAGLVLSLEEGERIWTESSHKYRPEDVLALGRRAGFEPAQQWIEPTSRFAESLFVVPRRGGCVG